jgi:hypothetical protein
MPLACGVHKPATQAGEATARPGPLVSGEDALAGGAHQVVTQSGGGKG